MICGVVLFLVCGITLYGAITKWFITTSIFFIVIIVIYGDIRKWFIKRKLRYFEYPKQWPIIGAAGRFFNQSNDQIIEIILDIYNEVESTPIQVWFGPLLVVGISEPEDVQSILTDDNCLNKPYFYNHLHCQSSIIATDRDIWISDRRALNTAFNIKILHSYIPQLNEKVCRLVQQMEPLLEKPDDLYRTIFISYMDSIARTTLGTEIDMQSKIVPQRGLFYYGIFKQIMENIQYRMA